MILRRIAKGIKEQDWFVVIIEVMIVVVGIFIGLQVDDWNEGRKNNAEDKVYLEQLRSDIVVSIEAGSTYKERHTKFHKSISEFVKNRGVELASNDDGTALAIFMRYALYDLNTLAFRRKAWQELINAGRYNSFADAALRTKIDRVIQMQDAMVNRSLNISVYTRDIIDPWLTENFDIWRIAMLSLDDPDAPVVKQDMVKPPEMRAILTDLTFWNMLAYRYMFTRDDLDEFELLEQEYKELLIEIDKQLAP